MAEERQDAGARTSSDGAPAFPWAEVAVRIRPFVASRVAPRDVDDVVQDTLLRLVANIDALRDPSRRPGWVRRVAQSAVVDHHRKMGRTPTAKAVHCEPPQLETLISAEARDEDEAHDTRAEELLGAWTKLVIGTLAEPYRTALTHVELEGMSQVDAARRAGVGYSTMKTRVQRGRTILRKRIEACCAVSLDARGRIREVQARDTCAC